MDNCARCECETCVGLATIEAYQHEADLEVIRNHWKKEVCWTIIFVGGFLGFAQLLNIYLP